MASDGENSEEKWSEQIGDQPVEDPPEGCVAPAVHLSEGELRTRTTHRLARLVLASFLMTFMVARILVILIMAGKMPPQLFLHVTGTHVHHLNYGITLLSVSGAYLLFSRPVGKRLSVAAAIYGLGLGLTFDEFGMWLHLGGMYWQGTSYNAIVVITGVLMLIAFGSSIRRWRPKHHATIGVLVVILGVFCYATYKSTTWAATDLQPVLEKMEKDGPG